MDPIGTKAGIGEVRSTAPVTRVAQAPAAVPVVSSADTPPQTPQVMALASELAASPPVDLDRVARVKKAVAEGNFPIYPATIADRLIALKYDWTPHDDAA